MRGVYANHHPSVLNSLLFSPFHTRSTAVAVAGMVTTGTLRFERERDLDRERERDLLFDLCFSGIDHFVLLL